MFVSFDLLNQRPVTTTPLSHTDGEKMQSFNNCKSALE
jgi:hypothetical protein